MNMNSKKTQIPVIAVEETRPALASRIKNKIKAVALRVKTAVVALARATRVVASKAWSKVSTTWREVFRPVMKTWTKWTAVALWAASLLVAPVATIAATLTAGAVALLLSVALDRLLERDGRAARLGVRMIKALVQVVRVAFYAVTGLLVVLMAAVSLPVAILLVADLTVQALQRKPEQREVSEAEIVAESLEVPTAKRRQKIEVVQPVVEAQERPAPKSKALRALGAEEMFDMSACDACGSIEGQFRYRSNDIEWTRDLVTGKDSEPTPSSNRLCSECYEAECEATAIELTGVSLKKRNVEFRLNDRGLTTLSQYANSLQHGDTLYWTIEATGWYRDHKRNVHDRSWSCFHKGKVVAVVNYAHRNKTYVAIVRGKVIGAERSLFAAKNLASDILMDERNATAVFVEALGGLLEAGQTPADLVHLGG